MASHRALFAGSLKSPRPADESHRSRRRTGKGTPKKLGKAQVQTCTLVRDGDGQWRVAAFYDTKQRDPTAELVGPGPDRAI
ncbi:hypothetical protein [Streptomyces sp. A1136]|uniref:hypothetical protein n=1 Tax=Streptomyces sp. A1136 TaxID=2563102 RepID=UPI0019D1A14A|nr:hypothetical protein [Streptomyces sp. A1136]